MQRSLFQRLMLSSAMQLLNLPRAFKRVLAVGVDVCLCACAVWLAYYLRLGELLSLTQPNEWGRGAMVATAASIGLAIPIFTVSGLYRAIFRYSGWPAVVAVVRASSIYGLIYGAIFTIVGMAGVPRTVGIIQPILLLLFVAQSRVLVRLWLGDRYQRILRKGGRARVLIYGAGNTGRQLAMAMTNSAEMQVVGFLDDDEQLHGQVLNGQPIYGAKQLIDLAVSLNIRTVLLAMPRMSRQRRNEVLSQMRMAHVSVRTLPNVSDLAQGKLGVSDLRDLDIDDLLGREPVAPDEALLHLNVRHKVVLVTGAGGSIGSELCRQITSLMPSKLLLIEQSEFALYAIHQELEQKLANSMVELIPLLASVQDADRLGEIMTTWHPQTVYHAAAYKHVPLVEHNPSAGIKNNVFGTWCAAKAAMDAGVENFVLISTDKAVRPTNIMGASKRLAEMVLQALSVSGTRTNFSMVRFGNVLGSSGSVVPKFRQQIRDGGPITLTHLEITRYFMTIPEAAQLVIQAGAMAQGGDVFVLDMGESVKIADLARRMVELSGMTIKDELNPEGEIAIEVTGLRPGEKLYEELLIGDNPERTTHERIMKAHEDYLPWPVLELRLNELKLAMQHNDHFAMRQTMQDLVSGYLPNEQIVDWIYIEQETA
jgi:FlaA1/EpsC-like NDP-sugar epimerase